MPMAPRELIALILGGAPLLPGKAEVIDQGWDRREGHEILRLRSGELEEELRFAWLGDRWWPVGASLYRRRGAELLWIWTVLHEDPRAVDGATLPSKTVITRPDGRRKQKVTITYKAQEPNPAVLAAADDSGGDDTGWEDDGGWEGEGEGNGDGGWESGGEGPGDGGGGWESGGAGEGGGGEGAAAGAGGAGEGATPASEPAPKPASKPASKPAKPTKPAIPSLFTLTGDGLPDRGNLCRYHRHS
ncbi:MAG: hypothetical protein H6710_19105 [Myxococcales bacterium]|nr:hypothetical protein [Myxococcales bacterium]